MQDTIDDSQLIWIISGGVSASRLSQKLKRAKSNAAFNAGIFCFFIRFRPTLHIVTSRRVRGSINQYDVLQNSGRKPNNNKTQREFQLCVLSALSLSLSLLFFFSFSSLNLFAFTRDTKFFTLEHRVTQFVCEFVCETLTLAEILTERESSKSLLAINVDWIKQFWRRILTGEKRKRKKEKKGRKESLFNLFTRVDKRVDFKWISRIINRIN